MIEQERIMKQIQIMVTIILILSPPAIAETVYEWTDADHTKRFSDRPPPPGTEYSEIVTSSRPSESTDERPGFNKMIEDAREESRRYEFEQQKKREEAQAIKKEKEQATRQTRIQDQRRDLERQIKALRNRALSTTFSQGMRDAQIKALENKIKQLETEAEN